MSCVKLLSENFADSEVYANVLESSANTSFPVTNVMARIRRSKVWRSAGYYNVTSSNNQIVFRDDASTNITATITTGEYTTTASFLSAVDTALEAVGAAQYTVTQNSNFKFVITSDLSGGATAFKLITTHASFTAASLLGFDTATDRTGGSTYTADFLRINSEEFITFDLGIPSNPTDFALIGLRNQPLKISSTATIKLQGNTTNEWSSPEYEETITYDDECLYLTDSAGFHTSNLRYWRVSFSDQNPYGYIEVGAIFLGESYEPTRGAVVFPFNSGFSDLSVTVRSEGGQSFSDVSEKTQGFVCEWQALTYTELEELKRIWEIYGTSHPFFMSFDSGAIFSSSANRMVKLVKFKSEPNYTLISPNNFNFSMQFSEDL